jgi:hypothetical protein
VLARHQSDRNMYTCVERAKWGRPPLAQNTRQSRAAEKARRDLRLHLGDEIDTRQEGPSA